MYARWIDLGKGRRRFEPGNLTDDIGETKNPPDSTPAKVRELAIRMDERIRSTGCQSNSVRALTTSSTSASLSALWNGSAIVRADNASVTGKSPGWYPNCSR